MNHIVMKTIFLCISMISVNLVGCVSNSQNENTAIGTVTGAVAGGLAGSIIGGGVGNAVGIGVGAVAGGIIGGLIGHSMDSTDSDRMYNAMDNNPTNRATTWTNEKTGTKYTVAPTSNRMTFKGNPNCRRYYTTAVLDGKKQKVSGIACQQRNGNWVTMR